MSTHILCGRLFTGLTDLALGDQRMVTGRDGRLIYVGPSTGAPAVAAGDELVDYSHAFVMPGLQDVHTHLAYGNAKSEEDIDLYHPMEFRSIRALFFCAAGALRWRHLDVRAGGCRTDQHCSS